MNENRRILLVDDDKTALELITDLLEPQDFVVQTAESVLEAEELLLNHTFQVVVSDLKMPQADGIVLLDYCTEHYPDMPVIMLTGHATVPSAVEALKKGAFDYLSKPVQIEEMILVLEKAIAHSRLKEENSFLREQIGKKDKLLLVSESEEIRQVYNTVETLLDINSTVLLTGESGTGKEVVARLIHRSSKRASGNFVPINCGAIPEPLIESELFGYEKGAFTDAKNRTKGKLEIAHGGTLFLDEINELPQKAQVSLLRFIQERVVVPLGSSRRIPIDVRIIAATNKNLDTLVERGSFRNDLYYRINVIPIHLPPLRTRREDILPLARWFLDFFSREHNRPVRSFSRRAEEALLSYDWPGNIRELRNCIERASIISTGPIIEPEALFLPDSADGCGRFIGESFEEIGIVPLRNLEEEYIRWVVTKLDGNKSRAAERLGVSVRGLRNKLHRNDEAHSH